MRWSRGEATVQQLLSERKLQQVIGEAADGSALLERAKRTLRTATEIIDTDPDSALILAYDAARQGAPQSWRTRAYVPPPQVATM